MLLRDTNTSDFRVPSSPHRQVAADGAAAKADSLATDALRRRDERDVKLNLAHERARARVQFVKMFADEGQRTQGLVARADEALKKYKSTPGALKGDDFDALTRDVRAQAMRIEASSRARGRVVETGKTLDTLVEATRTAPQNFEAHAKAARDTIEQQQPPAKAAAAFRERLAEIPETALDTLIGTDPEHAAQLIKRREGPADKAFGLDSTALRILAKQAAAALDEAETERTNGATVAAMRAHADAANAIAAAARGQGDEAGLTAWLAQADAIGPAAVRTLRRESKTAAKAVAARKAAAAAVREQLARGEDIGDADDDAVGRVFAGGAAVDERTFIEAAGRLPAQSVRRLAADLKSGDAARAQNAAEFVVALEAKNETLVARLAPSLRAEAHILAAAAKAGLTPAGALQHLRDAPDIQPADRTRRTQDFERTIDGAALAHAIEKAFAVRVSGIVDS